MIVYPNAKINIGLNVVEKRPDGYHDLETVFYPIGLQDILEIHKIDNDAPASGYRLKVTGTVLAGSPEDNLVVKAFKLLKKDFDLPPVSIGLYKHIPTGAGLGGGSADAAFTIKTLNERFSLGLTTSQMEDYCTQLGADCPFFIQNKPVFATGIGNVFHPLELNLKYKQLVLVKPDVFVSTKDAYAKVKVQHPEKQLPELLAQPIDTWKDTVVNDFEASVFSKYPEIAAIKDKMYDLGAIYASMSGSGSSVFGIFEDPVENVDEIFSGMFCRQRELS
ncbi:MAG: 4-(cytidine 5'-diphospho)-2-C-methyl-D-erythritol kinase [Bacteroidaceae bacterium]|nr:4-(cytidine 5'-diphospho)-2-C-methyl-D-erythritol kinase [Bacteroidaceae bacterium]